MEPSRPRANRRTESPYRRCPGVNACRPSSSSSPLASIRCAGSAPSRGLRARRTGPTRPISPKGAPRRASSAIRIYVGQFRLGVGLRHLQAMVRSSGISAVSTARRAAGLSRERLAAQAGVSVRTIYALEVERVRPRRATRRVLADALGLTPADLFPEDERPVAEPDAIATVGRTWTSRQADRRPP
jgi:DNA-binding XRE family transcriptional regulator